MSVLEIRKPGTVKCQRPSVSSAQPFSAKARRVRMTGCQLHWQRTR